MKKYSFLLMLFFLSLLPLVDLVHPGLPVTHDGQDHVARIANFYQSLREGNIVPRWAANLNWGYGHPILMFLYPLPSYMASLVHALGFSLVDATKLVFAVSYIASIFAMYLWGSRQWGNVDGFVAAILYGFAPYRFVDMYVRGALGEHVAFIWPPLVFLGLLQLARKKKFGGTVTAIATAGILLSHNAISLMVLPIIILYGWYLYIFEAKKRRRFLFHGLWFLALGFMFAAFFWMPAFFEGKYTLRDIVTKGDFHDRFVAPLWFMYSSWNYGGGNQLSKSLGLGQWLGVVASFALLFWSKRGELRIFAGGTLAILLTSLFFMTAWSELLWQVLTILQKFQFPWRLLTVSLIASSVLGAISLSQLKGKLRKWAVFGLAAIAVISTYPMWHARDYSVRPEAFYTGIYNGTTDTGESSPIWSVRFMERRPKHATQVIEGKAAIEELKRTSTVHRYRIITYEKSRLVENTLYFPGWQVWVDGVRTPMEFQDPNYRGLITYWLEAGEHRVDVRFGDTKLRQLADTISIIGIACFVAITLRQYI